MIDWRELMPSVPASVDPRNHPQNTQNPPSCRGFEDIEDGSKAFNGECERQPAPFAVGDRLTYRVPDDPEEGPFEVVMVSPDHIRGGWWAVVVKPSEKEGAEPKSDTPATVFIHQRVVTQVIPKESQTSTE